MSPKGLIARILRPVADFMRAKRTTAVPLVLALAIGGSAAALVPNSGRLEAPDRFEALTPARPAAQEPRVEATPEPSPSASEAPTARPAAAPAVQPAPNEPSYPHPDSIEPEERRHGVVECDKFHKLHAGGTKTISCTLLDPSDRVGTFPILCGDNAAVYMVPPPSGPRPLSCTPSQSELTIEGPGPWTFETTWTADFWGLRQTHRVNVWVDFVAVTSWEVTVPESKGQFSVACPEAIAVSSTGATPMKCHVESIGGYEGYVRLLYEWWDPEAGKLRVPATFVMVSPGAPAPVTLPVMTQAVPPGNYPESFAIQGEGYAQARGGNWISVDVH